MVKKLYYTKALLKYELEKCLNCVDKPCKQACPVGCDPSFFIQKAKENDFISAAHSIREKNPLGEICGLVCSSKFCMHACTRSKIDCPVNIPKIQATILQEVEEKDVLVPGLKKEKIAVVGGGPAGIGAAVTFAKNGFRCTLFEENDKIGGMLNLIPSSRLPISTLEKELNNLLSLPYLNVQTNIKISDPLKLIQEGYDYVVMATGEGDIKNLNLEGEEYMVSCFDYLKNKDSFSSLKKVAIIGAGNVALDCVDVLKEKGVSGIEMFMRRPLYLMKVDKERFLELIDARVNIHPNLAPIKIEKKEECFSIFFAKTIMENESLHQTSDIHVYEGFDLVIKAVGGKKIHQIQHEQIFYAGECKLHASSVVESLADGIQTAYKIMNPVLNLK